MASKIIITCILNLFSLINGQNANKILRIGSIFPEVNQKLAFAGKITYAHNLALSKRPVKRWVQPLISISQINHSKDFVKIKDIVNEKLKINNTGLAEYSKTYGRSGYDIIQKMCQIRPSYSNETTTGSTKF